MTDDLHCDCEVTMDLNDWQRKLFKYRDEKKAKKFISTLIEYRPPLESDWKRKLLLWKRSNHWLRRRSVLVTQNKRAPSAFSLSYRTESECSTCPCSHHNHHCHYWSLRYFIIVVVNWRRLNDHFLSRYVRSVGVTYFFFIFFCFAKCVLQDEMRSDQNCRVEYHLQMSEFFLFSIKSVTFVSFWYVHCLRSNLIDKEHNDLGINGRESREMNNVQ